MYSRKAINQYQQTSAGAVVDASPHKIISLLMQGALDRMAQAKGHIQQQQLEARNNAINKTSDIIDCLRNALDHNHSAELSNNLDSLYDYMLRRLFEANAKNDESIIDEVAKLLSSIYISWKQIEAPQQQAQLQSQLQPQQVGAGIASYSQPTQQAQLMK